MPGSAIMRNRKILKARLVVAAATLGGIVVFLGAASNAGAPVRGEIVLAPKAGDRLVSEPGPAGTVAVRQGARGLSVIERRAATTPMLE